MAEQNAQLIAFNRGVVSKYAMARVDLTRMRYSAAEQTNWMPRVFGPMMLRPGLGYLGINTLNNAKVKTIPFIRATNDAQILEASAGELRPLINEAPIVRPSVATAITNGTFAGSLTGWTNADESGATSAWEAGNFMGLAGTGTAGAIEYQAVTVSAPDQAKEHGIRIVVHFGTVGLRIGTAVGLDDLQQETQLGQGIHSLAITPNIGTFYIYFFNRRARTALVQSCLIEGPGVVTLPASWTVNDLQLLRWCQSADVMFICDGSHATQKIERRADHSWSLTLYLPDDGPYRAINFSPTTITPSDISGNITLVSSAPVFNPGHVGALWRLSSIGQIYEGNLANTSDTVGPLLITGTGTNRTIEYSVNGTFVGTLDLQKSDAPAGSYTTVKQIFPGLQQIYTDGLDNQILYYRVKFTAWTSGSAQISLQAASGSVSGDVRITGYNSSVSANATVLNALGGTGPTNVWYEGAWSDFRGYPTSNEIHEDRLWWFGLGQFWGSITDSFESFDDTVQGDSGTINRTIGKGPVDWINWGLGLLRLIVATDGTLVSARSDSLDTPLTPTNFNLKFPITQGAARIAPCSTDDLGYFVHRNLIRVYELSFDTSNYIKLDYGAADLTALCPEFLIPGVVTIAVQRQPDTRLHCVLSDGTVGIMVADKVENVVAWIKLETLGAGGFVEDVIVLPHPGYEDAVYYVVRRTVNGTTVRFYEKFALETDCVGGTLNKQADSFVIYSGGAANSMVAIAPHLAGQQVIVWADGKDLSPGPSVANPNTDPPTMSAQKTYTVASDGTVTLDLGVTVSNAVVGLPYEARFQGVKMAYGAQMGSALTMRKTISRLGLLLADTHSDGVRYGPDYDHLDRMPQVEGKVVPYDFIWDTYDDIGFSFDDVFGTDSRVCLKAYAPRPARVLGMIPHVDTDE